MKGMAALFIWVLLGLFFFAVTYMVLNEVYVIVNDWATTNITDPDSVQSMDLIDIIWTYWPLVILVGGYLMYMYSRSQKEQYK